MFFNRITQLFNIQYPIVQAGMIWASGWRMASAVSNAGGLGLIGSGSMYPDVLREHIRNCKAATDKPFGVNVPLMYAHSPKNIEVILEEGIKIVFTSAGNPKTYTPVFKDKGITVVHVVGSSMFALKAEEAGCDAVVAEGFEAGGHNGREETATMVLVPAVKKAVKIPVIAAGGIATGRQMLAAMVLGAEAVQMGSRFVCSEEASSHINFKEAVIKAREGDTMLSLKKIMPVRMMKNQFFKDVQEAEMRGATEDELKQILAKGRSRIGMFEGDLHNGELEIGEVSALIEDILPAADIVRVTWNEFMHALSKPLD
jgi:enoyl-[acyl-carrier protein] reductase II